MCEIGVIQRGVEWMGRGGGGVVMMEGSPSWLLLQRSGGHFIRESLTKIEPKIV